jgi:hypothetical protein
MPSAADAEVRPAIIGWKEYLDLPELGIRRLKAKVDTGARTSSLHVHDLAVVDRHGDGTAVVEFAVPLSRRHPERRVTTRARMLREVRVVDSGGNAEVRPVIETELVLGPVHKRILLTLTDRSGLLFRMLIGRKALEGDFLVDVAGKYLQRRFHPPPPRPRATGRAT